MWCGEQNKCPALCRGTTWKELLRRPYSSRQHKYLHFQILPHLGQCQRCTCVKNYFAYFPNLLSLDQEVLLIYHSTVLFHALNPPRPRLLESRETFSLHLCFPVIMIFPQVWWEVEQRKAPWASRKEQTYQKCHHSLASLGNLDEGSWEV